MAWLSAQQLTYLRLLDIDKWSNVEVIMWVLNMNDIPLEAIRAYLDVQAGTVRYFETLLKECLTSYFKDFSVMGKMYKPREERLRFLRKSESIRDA